MNVIEELRWRGLIQDLTPGTEEYLAANKVKVYLGVDPTGDTMHIGNLVAVMMLVNLQQHGHTPVALVGGATGMVGDPSGKDKERQLLDEEQIRHNAAGIKRQLESFLDFKSKKNKALVVNNYDWFKRMGFLEFLRDVGKHITISYMMNKESVRKRLESESGISYTEFAYQLLQGYDFYHLYKTKGVRMQVGGSDQWGNITTGTELIRRKMGSEEQVFAAVCPLLTRDDGAKFGKTADGQNIWLDPKKTSPYEFFQFWLNSADSDAARFIKIFTLLPQAEIEVLINSHSEAPHLRQLQEKLATDITLRVHGKDGLERAKKITEFLFGQVKELTSLSLQDWEEVAQAGEVLKLPREKLSSGISIVDLMVETGIAKSKGEAKRSIEQDKAIRLNLEKYETGDALVQLEHAFYGRFLQLQKGKKNKYIIELV